MQMSVRVANKVEIEAIIEKITDNKSKITDLEHSGNAEGGYISFKLGSIYVTWRNPEMSYFSFSMGRDRLDITDEKEYPELKSILQELGKKAMEIRGTGLTIRDQIDKYI